MNILDEAVKLALAALFGYAVGKSEGKRKPKQSHSSKRLRRRRNRRIVGDAERGGISARDLRDAVREFDRKHGTVSGDVGTC
jgi:hypothetical protein